MNTQDNYLYLYSMNTHNIDAADFHKKPYAAPQISVVEICEADIICTSTVPAFEDDPYNPWG